MEIQIRSPHLELTPAIRDFTHEKFLHLERFDNRIISAEVSFDVEHHNQKASATIHLKGDTIHAHADSDDLYQSITSLVKKLESSLKTYKEKLTDHRE